MPSQREKRTGPVPSADPARFEEAVKAFRRKDPITDDEMDVLDAAERERSFWVAGVAEADVVQQLFDAMDAAIERGTPLAEFRAAVEEPLYDAWGFDDSARIETIFRTNVMSAQNAGRYEIMTAPTVLDARPFWRLDTVEDDRQSDICAEFDSPQVILPADDPWWDKHHPPLHHNSVGEGTLIVTIDGEKPIESIRPGEMVLTHRRRWRPVVAVMGSRPDAPRARRLHLSTGRVLTVSDEHPVLEATSSRWKTGRDLKVGDKLFHHGEPPSGPREMARRNPDDCPALLDEGLVPYEIARLAGRAGMVFSVDLHRNPIGNEREVEHEPVYGVLDHEGYRARSNEPKGDGLRVRRPSSIGLGDGAGALDGNTSGDARIPESHALGMRGHGGVGLLPGAPEMMVLPAAMRHGAYGDGRLLGLRADLDPVPLAPIAQSGFSKPARSLNRADRFAAVPVAFLDQFSDSLGVSEVAWFHATIISIAEVESEKRLWNLAVWEDETFVAAGVIVHNCRSEVVPLSAEEAADEGLTDAPPSTGAAEGFGEPPSMTGDDWTPDLDGYDPEIAAVMKDRLGF